MRAPAIDAATAAAAARGLPSLVGARVSSVLTVHVRHAALRRHRLVLAVLFSIHSFIAGLALGIQSQFGSSAVAILIAILAHKFVEALSLASSFVKEGRPPPHPCTRSEPRALAGTCSL